MMSKPITDCYKCSAPIEVDSETYVHPLCDSCESTFDNWLITALKETTMPIKTIAYLCEDCDTNGSITIKGAEVTVSTCECVKENA
jgi:hypothetical protein